MKKIFSLIFFVFSLYILINTPVGGAATKCFISNKVEGYECKFSTCGGICKTNQRYVDVNSSSSDTNKYPNCCARNSSGCEDFVDCTGGGGTGGGTGGCGSPCDTSKTNNGCLTGFDCIGTNVCWNKAQCTSSGNPTPPPSFDCATCNFYASKPAKDNWDGQNGATCYRPENGGVACCSCLDGNGQCVGAWYCVAPGVYKVECSQTAPGQVCGPAKVPTATPIPTATPVASPTPTPTSTVPSPTINPSCTCDTGDVCNTTKCTFDKFTDVNYTSPLKCYLSSSLFPTPPTDKNAWCRRGLRTKGDADGNGVVNTTDYFYYVAAVNGGQIPANVNPDFNGDGEVGATDRTIVTKSLNP